MTSSLTPASADYVIVGGGTAGLVLANRLSEDPKVSVIVLEAGGNALDDPRVNVPAFWTALLTTERDWNYKTIPQEHLNSRQIAHPQGKLFGGSSGINAQVIIAPSKAGVDAWGKLGNEGWDFKSLAPYFRKFYTLHLPDQQTRERLGIDWLDESLHGTDGPIQASFAGMPENTIPALWNDTFKNLGLTTTADPFTGASTGSYSNFAAVNPETKTRSYAGSQYGIPILSRPNVQVVFNTTASKIAFSDSANPTAATGVEAIVDGLTVTFSATKEVIVSSGAFNSPKLLELSGIGNPDILSKHGIPVRVDLPGVGEHLQDHVMSGIAYEVKDGIPTADALMRQDPEALQQAQQMYFAEKKGPFVVGGITSHSFMPVAEFMTKEGAAEQETLFNTFTPGTPLEAEWYETIKEIIRSGDDGSAAASIFPALIDYYAADSTFDTKAAQAGSYATIGPLQEHPFSRGSSHISSADVHADPIIDPKYFSNPLDLDFLARHLLFCDKIRHTEPLASIFKPDGRRNHAEAHIKTIEDARKYLRGSATTTYHPCGTNAMLPREKNGVVDNHLRVYGTKNLRVIDCSIFPIIPRGNIMSSVYAVAEKAADMIKQGA